MAFGSKGLTKTKLHIFKFSARHAISVLASAGETKEGNTISRNTKIEWTHHTFNPWKGCSKVHTGCKFCYAEDLAGRRFGEYWEVEWGPHGKRSRTSAANWREPLKWNREAMEAGERHRVFCASLADVFEDRPELVDWRAELFELIDATQQLDWLILTKRPENVCKMWPDDRYRENVWLGTSVSDQATADVWTERLIGLRHLTPILFLSVEPLIGPVTIPYLDQIDWTIVGGESHRSPKIARRCDDEWIRSVVEQCRSAEVPVFVKQLGTRQELKHKKGGDMAEWPADLRVREFPALQVES